MQIKTASNKDVDAIISLLRKSLGESQLPFSKEIWEYKHHNNPSGNSLALLAVSEEELIGVRVLMKWKWQLADKSFFAFRAVDTGTHPNHQRKGVFKLLNQEALKKAISNGDHFIFNTPNKLSLPGNIKMGWEPISKVQVGVKIWSGGFNFRNTTNHQYEHEIQCTDQELIVLCDSWNQKLERSKRLFCPKSIEHLKWRYETNPLQEYQIFSHPNFYLAGYLKKRGRFSELRISECIFLKNNEIEKQIKKKIKEWCYKFNPHIITFSPDFFVTDIFSVKGKFGPILTIRKLNLDEKSFQIVKDINNWSYSLGDLELF